MEHPSDTALLRAARTDAAAFERFYRAWAPPLHAWIRRRVSEPEAANDLTAETFAQALLGLHRFRGQVPGQGAAWLWGIARNLVHQHYRTSRLDARARERLGVAQRAYDDSGWEEAEARVLAAARAHELAAAMTDLSVQERRALELRVLAELDFGMVAEYLRCTQPAARMRVSRALSSLRARLQGARP